MIQNKFQVNLPVWMTDYLEKVAEEFGISMSEFIRFHVSMSLICSAVEMYEDFKSPFLKRVSEPCSTKKFKTVEERERFIENVLHEAQRAVKHRIIKEFGKYPLS